MKRTHTFERKTIVSLLLLFMLFINNSIAQNKMVDATVIAQVMGIKGKSNNGEYKITIPQNDLNVVVDSFKIIPAMGLSTWVAFSPSKDGVMAMGDLVLTETDVKLVQQEVIRQGLTITAIHNHFIRNHPNIIYMHVGGCTMRYIPGQNIYKKKSTHKTP